MNISKNGIELIKKYEGLRLSAYKPVPTEKYFTIGWGHYGADVKEGQEITREKADEMFLDDIKKYVDGVNKLLKVGVNQNQFDALVSFAYNCGLGALQRSDLLACVNKKNFDDAAKEFGEWVRGGGKVLLGLVRRRQEEQILFLKPVPKPKPKYPGTLIKEGSRGKYVGMVQKVIGAKVDGIFGPKTEAAVKAFQKKKGLAVDGIVGPNTWAKLF